MIGTPSTRGLLDGVAVRFSETRDFRPRGRRPKVDEDVPPCVEINHAIEQIRGAGNLICTQAPPAADLSYPAGSSPACREVSLVLNLATNADGVEDPQPIFDYAATGACAAIDE